MRLTTAITIFLGFTSMAAAAETVVKDGDKQTLNITIYNQNLALVKDVRKVDLKQGINDIAFEGVASGIKPSSVILYADGIQVLEQNYDYDVLNLKNIIDKSVGSTIKTLKINPANGEKMFDTAEIISAQNGKPVLKFDYGVDADFDGQLLFEKLPEGLRKKPTLVTKISSNSDRNRDISLAYLTNGISWKTDYVAKVVNNERLDMTAWVTINNESGTDYSDAKVQLVAGKVNQTREVVPMSDMVMLAAAPKMAMGNRAVGEQDLSAYHLYTLPNQTTIKDKQTKQITLMEKNNVKYTKEAELVSSLYFSPETKDEFKNKHLSMYYTIINNNSSNLGVQLPAGIIRFYENDEQGNLQFIGESKIDHVAKEEIMHLYLGNYSNIFANGKIVKITKQSEEEQKMHNNCTRFYSLYNYDVEIEVYNSGKEKQQVKIKQNLPQDAEIVKQNAKGSLSRAGMYEWALETAPDSKQMLSFSVKAPFIIKEVCSR